MTLTATDFTDYRPGGEDQAIAEQVAALRGRIADKRFSDTEDAAGQQYVDLVMEGGGVLGIALMGYVYVLEQVGLRFLSIAGTSAGAVTALMLAGLDVPARAKSERALPILAGMPIDSFVDGNQRVQRFVDGVVRGLGTWRLGFRLLRVRDVLLSRLGLNPGHAFERWVEQQLAAVDIRTLDDLLRRMNAEPEGLRVINPKAQSSKILADDPLCLIAADISTETRARLPEMARLYYADWRQVSPAKLARMSMAVPYFFEPVVVPLDRDKADKAAWIEEAAFSRQVIARSEAEGKPWLPERALFVDGGVLSNFPIDVFHDHSLAEPGRPTFGVKLQLDVRAADVTSIGDFSKQVFNSARHILDIETIRRNPEFAQLVTFIDTGTHNWLNFNLEDKAKLDLFYRGAVQGMRFLERFDWDAYKQARSRISAGQREMERVAAKAGVADAVQERRFRPAGE